MSTKTLIELLYLLLNVQEQQIRRELKNQPEHTTYTKINWDWYINAAKNYNPAPKPKKASRV